MKKVVLGVLVVAMVACFGSVSFAEKVWELRMHEEHPTTSPFHVYGHVPWVKDIEKATNGRVKITIYPMRTLMKGTESWNGVKTGIAHMAHVFAGYYPGQFDLLDVISLPFIAPNGEVASRVAWALYNKYPEIQAQSKDAKMLTIWTTEPYFFLTSKKQIKTLEDFKGMKLRMTGGPPTEMMKLLKGIPTLISMNDVYPALQKGVLDGMAAPGEAVSGFRFYEVAKYYTWVPTVATWFMHLMNWDTWNSFPPDIQKAIMSVSGERQAVRYGGGVFDRAHDEMKSVVKKAGHEMVEYTPSKQEIDRWIKIAGKPVWDNWVAKMEAKGHSKARQILEDCLKLIDEFSKKPSLRPVEKTLPVK
jgi:TRAP-type C4-dicarboxylate transport system substrate-binding protein